MFDHDPAESPLASYTPDIAGHADTLRDFLRESFAAFRGDIPTTLLAFRKLCFTLIDAALAESGTDHPRDSEASGAMVRLLQLMSGDTDHRVAMRAYSYLRLSGYDGRTFQQVGDALGVKRATVHKCYRDIQRRLGDFPGRGDKSPTAREKFRILRLGAKRPRQPWPGLNAWKTRQPAAA